MSYLDVKKAINTGLFLGTSGYLPNPLIQLNPNGDVKIFQPYNHFTSMTHYSVPTTLIIGNDAGLRDPINWISYKPSPEPSERKFIKNEITDFSKLVLEKETAKDKIQKLKIEAELIQKRTKILSRSKNFLLDPIKAPPLTDKEIEDVLICANYFAKQDIDRANAKQYARQNIHTKIFKSKGKHKYKLICKQNALSSKQTNINRSAAHLLSKRLFEYAKHRQSQQLLAINQDDVDKINEIHNDKSYSEATWKEYISKTITNPTIWNKFTKINLENLRGFSPKSGDSYVLAKSNWLRGKIPEYLEDKCNQNGMQINMFVPAAYTSKIYNDEENDLGAKGWVIKKIKKELYFAAPPEKEINNLNNVGGWRSIDELHYMIQRSLKRKIFTGSPKFVEMNSGNYIKKITNDPTDIKFNHRDINAAKNIAQYQPMVFQADQINFLTKRVLKTEDSSDRTKIYTKISGLIDRAKKAIHYTFDESTSKFNF